MDQRALREFVDSDKCGAEAVDCDAKRSLFLGESSNASQLNFFQSTVRQTCVRFHAIVRRLHRIAY
jgi:hypothetical protein